MAILYEGASSISQVMTTTDSSTGDTVSLRSALPQLKGTVLESSASSTVLTAVGTIVDAVAAVREGTTAGASGKYKVNSTLYSY